MSKGEDRQTNQVEALLRQRAQSASELPWLEMRVLSQVEWREQARLWLKQHPGGLGGRRPQPLRLRLWSALCALATARLWHAVGIALTTAGLVWLLTQIPALAPTLQSTARWGGLTTLAAVMVVLAVALANWPRLRQFYS